MERSLGHEGCAAQDPELLSMVRLQLCSRQQIGVLPVGVDLPLPLLVQVDRNRDQSPCFLLFFLYDCLHVESHVGLLNSLIESSPVAVEGGAFEFEVGDGVDGVGILSRKQAPDKFYFFVDNFVFVGHICDDGDEELFGI